MDCNGVLDATPAIWETSDSENQPLLAECDMPRMSKCTKGQMTIPLKAWVIDEARRCDISPGGIFNRLYRGKYSWLPLKRVNQRVVLVELDKMTDWAGIGPHNDWL